MFDLKHIMVSSKSLGQAQTAAAIAANAAESHVVDRMAGFVPCAESTPITIDGNTITLENVTATKLEEDFHVKVIYNEKVSMTSSTMCEVDSIVEVVLSTYLDQRPCF